MEEAEEEEEEEEAGVARIEKITGICRPGRLLRAIFAAKKAIIVRIASTRQNPRMARRRRRRMATAEEEGKEEEEEESEESAQWK